MLHHDDALERRTGVERIGQEREARGARDEDTNAAVVENVCDLLRLQEGVDGDEHAAGSRDAEDGFDRLQSLLDEDGDAIVLRDPEVLQADGEPCDGVPELAVAPSLAAVAERSVAFVRARALSEKVMES